MTQPSLEGVRAKIARAHEHLEDLRESIEGELNERPYRVVSQPDPKTGECVLYGEYTQRPPLIEWGVQVGDVVHNLRSGLDQLAWTLALLKRPDRRPPNSTAFPLAEDPDWFESDGQRRISAIGHKARKRIKKVQPCYRSNRPWNDPLTVLSRLSNEDKHRLVVRLEPRPLAASYFVTDDEAVIQATALIVLGGAGHEGELGRLPPQPNCAELADKLNFTYHIAFDPEGPARGTRVLDQLERCRDSVRDDVVPLFADLF